MKNWFTFICVMTLFIAQLAHTETVEEAIDRAQKDGSAERAANTDCAQMKKNQNVPGTCLTDDEMRDINGPLIAPGVFTPEVERQLIEAIKNNDQATLATVQLVNQSSIAAKTGQMTEELVQKNLNQYLVNLINAGIPQSIIEAQLQQAFIRQEQMLHENQITQLQQQIMNEFLQSIDSKNRTFSLAAFYIAYFQFPMNGQLLIQSRFGQIELKFN